MAKKVREELEVVTPSINTRYPDRLVVMCRRFLFGREIAEEPTVLMTAYAVDLT